MFFLGIPHWISLYSWLLIVKFELGEIWLSIVPFSGSWNFGQSFVSNWNSFSNRALYLLDWLIGSTLHGTKAFSPIQNPTTFLAFRKFIFLLYFTSNSSFYFIDITWSWASQTVLLAFWTFPFICALFCVVWILCTTFCTCQSSSASFPLMSIFLTS